MAKAMRNRSRSRKNGDESETPEAQAPLDETAPSADPDAQPNETLVPVEDTPELTEAPATDDPIVDPEPVADDAAEPGTALPDDTPNPEGAETVSQDEEATVLPPPATPPVSRDARQGWLAPVAGGVIAAAIGAGVALWMFPQGWQPLDLAPIQSRIAALEGRPQGLGAEALAPLRADLDALSDRVTQVQAADPAASVQAELAALVRRVAALEEAPDVAAVIAPLRADIDAAVQAETRAAVEAAMIETRAALERQAAEVAAQSGNLAQRAALVSARAALAEVTAAAESGAPAAEALASLAAYTDVPRTLAPVRDGLVTLSALQEEFAPAARAALAAEPTPPDAGVFDRLGTFLRNQTGARSLAPREGDSTDAILSRAEAALRRGDLGQALTELGALTGAPAEAMAEWQARTETRLAAERALADLQDALNRSED